MTHTRERYWTDRRLDRAEAREEGREEGEAKKAIAVAQNLKRLGAPLSMIAEATGLSLSEIERLG